MIELLHVSHAFGGSRGSGEAEMVLSNISLVVEDGSFVSFLGPSGCGKTTLLRIIHGLLHPTRGSVLVDGKVVLAPSRDRTLVFQEPGLLPWRTALANTELGLEIQGMPRRERRSRASEMLRSLDMGHVQGHYPHQLSGGMKHRVELARALCTDPACLLMDEPFSGLDVQARELMQVELLKLWEADRKTVLFVTHSVEEAVFLSDRVVVFSARPGRIVETFDIDLPRPRWSDDQAVRSSAAFLAYRQQLTRLLRSLPSAEGSRTPWPSVESVAA